MLARALGSLSWRVLLLFSESLMDRRHAPVPESARRVLAMELAVLRIARIARERRPDLAGDAVVPRDRHHVGLRHVVRAEEIDIARRRLRGRQLDALFVHRP